MRLNEKPFSKFFPVIRHFSYEIDVSGIIPFHFILLSQINNFTCSCTPQFMGRTCDRAYNACVEQACQNGGQCIVTKNERDPGNDFYCECPEGFNGLRCENNVNECEGVVCTDNKICVDLVSSFRSHQCFVT